MASPKKVNIENIERKMQGVSNTQDSIQSLSLWAIHHKAEARQIVDVWFKVLKKASIKQRLALFNLCNDIVQNGKRKKATIYIDVYKDVMRDAVNLVKDDAISKNIKRILKIWKERHVFPRDFITEIAEFYESKDNSTHSTPTPIANSSSSNTPTSTALQTPKATTTVQYNANIDPQAIENFKPQSLIEKITNYKRYEAEVELKRKQLSNMKLDASSTEAIKQLKDKAHGNQFSKQFEESCSKLEDYVSSADKDIKEKAALIELLETSQLFYEEQYKEAKIVANAYKNFGTRINNLRKRLDDLVKSLPSPVPSPSRDAPSPGNTPPEETLDNIESVDMDLDDETSNSLIPKSVTETAAVVVEGAEDSYDPGSDDPFPLQPQLSQPFDVNADTLQTISTIMASHQSVAPVSQPNPFNGHDPRKTQNEVPVYNPPPKASAIKVVSNKQEEGGGTPVKDEGSSTPVMDEKQDSPPPTKHQNPIDFLTQILANTAKTTATGSNFLASLSLLTNTVKTQFQNKKEDTTMINNQPIMSEQTAGSWAEWKSQNTPVPPPVQPPPIQAGPLPPGPPMVPPPMFPQMAQMSQPPPISIPQPSMVTSHMTASSSQNHQPTSPPILSTSVNQHPYRPGTPSFGPVNPPPRPPDAWRPPNLGPVPRPPFSGFMGSGDHLSSPTWRQPPPNPQSQQSHEGQQTWENFQHNDLPSPNAPVVSPPVQPKGILRNRSSLREIALVENDGMAINPEPPAEPPSPIEGKNKFHRPSSESAPADDHREFLEKLKRKTTGGPNLVSPPVVEDNFAPKMFTPNRSRPNLTTITPVDLDEQLGDNHLTETENGAHEMNDSLHAIGEYAEQEGELIQEEEMMEEGAEEGYEEEQYPVEEQYDERPYGPPRDFRPPPPFHRHPRPPPPHVDPFFRPRFPPRFERPFRRDPYPDPYMDPYGPPKRPPFHEGYRPFRRPYPRY